MKKTASIILLLLLVLITSSFFFFPAVYELEQSIKLQVNAAALQRVLMQQSIATANNKEASSKPGPALLLHTGMDNSFVLSTSTEGGPHMSQLKLLSLNPSLTQVYWNGVVTGGSSPWQRFQTWRKSRDLTSKVRSFLSHLTKYENEADLYGFNIAFSKVRDSVMVATRFTSRLYPSTEDIYRHVHLLRQYIASQGAQATNHPMLFVQPSSQGFEAQVAVPTNRLLQGTGAITYRRMVMGNILEAEIKGGQAKVEEALQQMGNFVSDKDLISPAIPFALLVTDRTKEPDSSKWITRIYYPIY